METDGKGGGGYRLRVGGTLGGSRRGRGALVDYGAADVGSELGRCRHLSVTAGDEEWGSGGKLPEKGGGVYGEEV